MTEVRKQTNLKARVSLYGSDWLAIKEWLEIEREHAVAKLCKAATWDDSNKHRGAIEMIDKLLGVEKDAAIAASNKG